MTTTLSTMTMMPHAIDIIKGEIHRVVAVLRTNGGIHHHSTNGGNGGTTGSSSGSSLSNARFRREIPLENESSLLRSMRNLYAELSEENTLTNEQYHDLDAVSFTKPFLDILTTDEISGIITNVALASINKFLLYGFLNDTISTTNTPPTTNNTDTTNPLLNPTDTSLPLFSTDNPMYYRQPYYIVRSSIAINAIVYSTTHCRFEPSSTKEDEAILMKLLEVLGNTLRCGSSIALTDENIWNIIQACFRISRVEQSSHLLQRTGESTLAHVIMHVFSRAHEIAQQERRSSHSHSLSSSSLPNLLPFSPLSSSRPTVLTEASSTVSATTTTGTVGTTTTIPTISTTTTTIGHKTVRKPYGSPILRRVIAWLASLADPKQHGRTTRLLGLELINIVLETGGESLGNFPGVVEVIQNDLCKSLIANSRTTDLPTLALTLRVVFNLFGSMKSHLKVQLEVFLTSVHLTLADTPSALPEQRELALESLLEFCREPTMMLDLYVNFDCDVACANLFEALARCVCRCAVPDDPYGGQTTLTVLHTLAFECVVTILGTIAQRCPNHPVWQQRLHHYYTSTLNNEDHTNTEGKDNPNENDDNENENNAPDGEGRTKSTHPSIPPPSSVPVLRTPNRPSSSFSSSAAATPPILPSTMNPLLGTPTIDPAASLAAKNTNREQITQVLRQRRLLKRRMAMAAVRFNTDQKHWVEYAQELELLPTPADAGAVAKFFRECPGLDKTLIGLYISEPDDTKHTFHTAVRKAYVASFNFHNLRVDEALRVFLESFRLPGEAQKIERLMQAFSEHVYAQSPGSMHHPDTAFVLSYSIIMLNTDLHNKQVRKKMTLEQFLSNNRKIDQNQDLPKEFLTDIYKSIAEKEIMLRADAPMVPTATATASFNRNTTSSSSFNRTGSSDNLNGKDGNGSGGTTNGSSGSGTPGGNNGSSTLGSSQILGSENDTTNLLGNQWDGVLRRQTAVTAYTSSARMLMGTGNTILTHNALTNNNSNEVVVPPGCPIPAGAHERDMFHLMAESTLTALAAVFSATRDATVLKRTALGFRDFSVLTAYYGMTKQLNALIIVLSRSIISDMDMIGDIAEQSTANHPHDPQMETLLEYARTCARTYAQTVLRTNHGESKNDDSEKTKMNERNRTKESLEILLMEEDTGNTSSPAVTPGRTRPDRDIGTPSVRSPAAIARTGPVAGRHPKRQRGLSYMVGDSDDENEDDPSVTRPRRPVGRSNQERPRKESGKGGHANSHHSRDQKDPPAMSIDDLNEEDHTPTVQTDTDESDAGSRQYDSAEEQGVPTNGEDDSAWVTVSHHNRRKQRHYNLFASPGALVLRRMLLGLRTLLSIVSENCTHIKEAWRNIIEVIARLGINDCLPPGFLDVDDFRSPNGMLIASVSSGIPFRQPVNAAFSLASAVIQIRENLSSATSPSGTNPSTDPSPLASLPSLLGGSRYLNEALKTYSSDAKKESKARLRNESHRSTDDESENHRSGLWGTISSFFTSSGRDEGQTVDVAETILTAIACEVTRTNALPLLISKSSSLPDDILVYLLQAVATVRDPLTLARNIFGLVSSDSNSSESRFVEQETDDATHVINATVSVEIFATIAIRNIHRIQIVLPALLYFYRTLLMVPSGDTKVNVSTYAPSRGVCFVTERIVINLLRIAIRVCSVDEASFSTAASNIPNASFQYKDDDAFDDDDMDNHSTDSSSTASSLPFGSSNDNLCPLNVAVTCLRLFADIHPSVFAVVAPRISAGLSLLLHVGPTLAHLVPFGSKDEQAINFLASLPETDESNPLFVFFGAIFSLLNSCQPYFFASPGVWDTLCHLGSGVLTHDLAQAVRTNASVSVEIRTKALQSVYRLHGRIFASMFRIGATYLNPCLRDEVVAGCAASIFLADIHGDASTSLTSTANDTHRNGNGSTSPWGRRGRERSWSGFGSKKSVKASLATAHGNVANVAAAVTQGRAISSEAMQAAVAAAEAEAEALALASTEYHAAMCTLITDQSLGELREFIAQAILRLLEQLALSFPSSSSVGTGKETDFLLIQWLSSLRVLQATTIALLMPFSDAITNVASLVQGRIPLTDTEKVWNTILQVSLTEEEEKKEDDKEEAAGSTLSTLTTVGTIPALPFPFASLLHLPSPQEESAWLRTSSSIVRLVVSTIQRLLLTHPFGTTVSSSSSVIGSRSTDNHQEDYMGPLWDQVFYSILFPLQHSTIIRAMGSLPPSLSTVVRQPRKERMNLSVARNADENTETENTSARAVSSSSSSSSSSSRTLSFAAALRQAINEDLQSTSTPNLNTVSSFYSSNHTVTLDRAEALVQVNGILSKTILQLSNSFNRPSSTSSSSSPSSSLCFTLPYFLEHLWYPTFYSYVQLHQQAYTLLHHPSSSSSSFSSSFALLTSKSKAMMQQEQEEHRAACQLLTESCIDDIRKLFFVLSGIPGLKEGTNDARTFLGEDTVERIRTLYRTVGQILNDALPMIVKEVQMIVPGIVTETMNGNDGNDGKTGGTYGGVTVGTMNELSVNTRSDTNDETRDNDESTVVSTMDTVEKNREKDDENSTVEGKECSGSSGSTSSTSEDSAVSGSTANAVSATVPMDKNTNETIDTIIPTTTMNGTVPENVDNDKDNDNDAGKSTTSVRATSEEDNALMRTTGGTENIVPLLDSSDITPASSVSTTTNGATTNNGSSGSGSGGGLFSSFFRVMLGEVEEDT